MMKRGEGGISEGEEGRGLGGRGEVGLDAPFLAFSEGLTSEGLSTRASAFLVESEERTRNRQCWQELRSTLVQRSSTARLPAESAVTFGPSPQGPVVQQTPTTPIPPIEPLKKQDMTGHHKDKEEAVSVPQGQRESLLLGLEEEKGAEECVVVRWARYPLFAQSCAQNENLTRL